LLCARGCGVADRRQLHVRPLTATGKVRALIGLSPSAHTGLGSIRTHGGDAELSGGRLWGCLCAVFVCLRAGFACEGDRCPESFS
jgi:hypothetical protein